MFRRCIVPLTAHLHRHLFPHFSEFHFLPPAHLSPPVVRDPSPQWRTVCWSLQDTWLAVGNRLVSSCLTHPRAHHTITCHSHSHSHIHTPPTSPTLSHPHYSNNPLLPCPLSPCPCSTGELFVVGKNGALLGRLKSEAGEGAGLAVAYAGLMFVPAENFGERLR